MDKSILIVDDAVFVRKMTADVLKKAGYDNIYEAATAVNAKSMFLQIKPDLVVLDVTLPDCEDLALCNEFFRLRPDAKIIMYSAVTQDLVVKEAKEMGVIEYFTKPMDNEKFIAAVDSVLKN